MPVLELLVDDFGQPDGPGGRCPSPSTSVYRVRMKVGGNRLGYMR